MTSSVEKLQRFVALALGSKNENEARNAAMHVCRMISEKKVDVVEGRRGFAGRPAPPMNVVDFAKVMEDLFGGMDVRARTSEHWNAYASGEAEKIRDEVRRRRSEVRPTRHPSGAVLITMTGNYSGMCRDCHTKILPGDKAWWLDIGGRAGTVHERCDPTVMC